MDLALAEAFDPLNKMDERKTINDFWVFFYLEDGIRDYPELGIYSENPTLTPVDLIMIQSGKVNSKLQLMANVPLNNEKYKWIHCTSGNGVYILMIL